MLNFNPKHKSLKGSLEKNPNKIKLRNVVLAGIALSSIAIFSGCAKTVDCDIEGLHAHNYVNEESFDKYMISEKEYKGNWDRTDEYITVDKDMKELIDFANDKNLFRISDNQEKIKEISSEHKDYVEYRYKYTWLLPIPHTTKIGKTTSVYYTYIPQTSHSWTPDPKHSRLTGEQRVVHYMYYGYKIVKDDKGKYKVIESELVDSLDELPQGYYYIKEKFYKKVNLNNKKLEVDYEDGPEENKQLVEDQQAEYEEQLKEEQKSK